jgi:hypothetical protein
MNTSSFQNNNLETVFKSIYGKKSYFKLYGGSVFATFLILLIFFIIFSYFYVMNDIKSIRKNWVVNRCNPAYIPFAGMINKDPHKGVMDSTSSNFNYCLNNILTSITSDFLLPIHYAMDLAGSSIKDVTASIQMVRKKFASLIHNLENINNELFGKMFAFVIPIQHMFVKFKDMLLKTNSTILTTLYSMIAGYLGIKSFAGAFVQMMIMGLLALTAIIVPMLMFVFTAPLAIPLLVAFSIVAGFTTSVIVGLEDIIHMSTKSVPDKPHCFDSNTKLKLKSGEIKTISNIEIGDILHDGCKVTGLFKVSRNEMNMFLYKNVVVSGCHNVKQEKYWLPVQNLVEAIYLPEYNATELYCLNTTTGIININGILFSDWNDIDDEEMKRLRALLFDIDLNNIRKEELHTYLDSGLCEDTMVDLFDGSQRMIRNLSIGDKLKGYGEIIGLVCIDSKDIDVIQLQIGGKVYTMSKNNTYRLEAVGHKNELFNIQKQDNGSYINSDMRENSTMEKPNKLYHILVSNGLFYSNGIMFKDYNYGLEQFI